MYTGAIWSLQYSCSVRVGSLYFYRLQHNCGKVMYSQASVILFMGGGCVSQHAMGQTPPRQTPPWADIPHPWADPPTPRQTPPMRHHSQGRHPPGRHPPPPTATAVDSTHPTGMHSCLLNNCLKIFLHYKNVIDFHKYTIKSRTG